VNQLRAVSRKHAILFALLVFLVLPTILACAQASSLRVLSSDLTARQFIGDSNVTKSMAAVTGTLRNEGDSAASNCRVVVEFFDDQKNSLGSAAATKESLASGETWNFVVQLTNPDAWKARSYSATVSNQ
jgi:spermidine/putrescine-binding protein